MCIGPMSLVQMAPSRAIRWAARRMANGGSKRMSCASIAARMTEAATRCGCPGRMWNSEGQACRLHPREFCSRQRPVIDLDGFGRLLSAGTSDSVEEDAYDHPIASRSRQHRRTHSVLSAPGLAWLWRAGRSCGTDGAGAGSGARMAVERADA